MPDPPETGVTVVREPPRGFWEANWVHSSPRGRTLECAEEAESCPTDYLQEAENFSTGMLSIKEQARGVMETITSGP